VIVGSNSQNGFSNERSISPNADYAIMEKAKNGCEVKHLCGQVEKQPEKQGSFSKQKNFKNFQ
jgi:hypothetical protein